MNTRPSQSMQMKPDLPPSAISKKTTGLGSAMLKFGGGRGGRCDGKREVCIWIDLVLLAGEPEVENYGAV